MTDVKDDDVLLRALHDHLRIPVENLKPVVKILHEMEIWAWENLIVLDEAVLEAGGISKALSQQLRPYRTQATAGSKRPRSDYYPVDLDKRSRKLRSLDGVVSEYSETPGMTRLYFGIQNSHEVMKNWLSKLYTPISLVQQKSLLLVDGPVKSGKTTFSRFILPEVLCQIRDFYATTTSVTTTATAITAATTTIAASTTNVLSDEFREKRVHAFGSASFAYVYLDLSELAGKHTPNEKWRALDMLFRRAHTDVWPEMPNGADPFNFVLGALVDLKGSDPTFWVVVLDEFHFMFEGLSEADSANVAESLKHLVLDDHSNFHFVLAGSTQATFWWAVQRARANGLNMLLNASIITTPFTSSQQEIQKCFAVLLEEKVCTAEQQAEIMIACPDESVPSLVQILSTWKLAGGQSGGCHVAYEQFLASKAAVYWRDYDTLPGAIDDSFSLAAWAEGDTTAPPTFMQHLFLRKGNLFYFADQFFCSFIKAHYDPQKRILSRQQGVPWPDIMLIHKIIPVASGLRYVNSLEQQGKAICHNFDAFYTLLINHPSNSIEKGKGNAKTMARAMGLFRNILAHERSAKWRDLTTTVAKAAEAVGGREKLRELIDLYYDAVMDGEQKS